jgi:1-acyl-sn-glycerol-3-phosphate acyltransferase
MNTPVNQARLRLALLWLAVFARAVGEGSVRTYGILHSGNAWMHQTIGFIFLWLGLAAAPALALAPLIGAVASSRARWAAMIMSTLAGLAIIAWTSLEEYRGGRAFWLGCAAVLALESAFFAGCRFAILPQASREASVSLPQLNAVFAVAIVAGMLIGLWIGIERLNEGKPGLAVPLQLGHVGYGLALVCVLLARFMPVSPIRINDGLVLPFLRAARTIFRDRDSRNSLIALWGLFLIALAVSHWLMPQEASMRYQFLTGLLIGLTIGGLHGHPFRSVGMAPLASIGLLICTIWAATANNWHDPSIGMAFCIGIAAAPLFAAYQIHQPEPMRGHGAALLHAGWALLTFAFLGMLLAFVPDPPAARPTVAGLVLCLAIVGAGFACLVFFRPLVELLAEWILLPFYRVRARGPGLYELPWTGPVIVIANHAAWFDPLWLGKVVPAPIVPMMISRFYDLPFISWFMRKVVDAVRVPDMARRKDAPELNDVIARLDAGRFVAIFPEGWLRRKEEHELRRFGRGIWQILKARPNTPIFACWIEGGWGSFVSYKNGPPMKNKRLDIRRKIRIAIIEPFTIDPAQLEDHMSTRVALMKKVLEARTLLGLPPIDPFQIHARDDDADDKQEDPS